MENEKPPSFKKKRKSVKLPKNKLEFPKIENEVKEETTKEDESSSSDSQKISVIYNDDGSVKGATFKKLVEILTSPAASVSIIFDFLLTYRTYATPQKLISLLTRRFKLKNSKSKHIKVIRLKVINLTKQWIEKHEYDWISDASLKKRLRAFIEFWKKEDASFTNISDHLLEEMSNIEDGIEKYASIKVFSTKPPPTITPANTIASELHILDISPVEFARQLTLMEWDIWESIKPWEFLNQAWTLKDKEVLAPNITRMIQHFNKITSWIATEIVRSKSSERRQQIISHFIDIAEQMRIIGNLNGLLEFVLGLGNPGVYRLKKSWDRVDQEKKNLFNDLKELASSERSYYNLRNMLKTVNPPTIPYIGVFLADIFFINQGSNHYIKGSNNLINFTKCRNLAQQIKLVIQYQQTIYNFSYVTCIYEYLSNLDYWSDETIYQWSLYREPKPGTERIPKPSIHRLGPPPEWGYKDPKS